MDNLGQMLNQVDTIERHMKYLQCLQHMEELRYCKRDKELKCLLSFQKNNNFGIESWVNREKKTR